MAIVFALVTASTAADDEWKTIANDGIHDPRSPAAKLLQQPGAALSVLPRDKAGNMVRWVESLDQGLIKPRAGIRPDVRIRKRDTDVIMNVKGGMPAVRFPHRQHTEWLDCSSCHDTVFKEEAGGSNITMLAILEGEQCGICHGAVSFPLTECARCHSIPRPGEAAPVIPDNALPEIHRRSPGGK